MTFTNLVPANPFPWFTGDFYLVDPEQPLHASDILKNITRAGYKAARKKDADAIADTLHNLQREHPIVVLGETFKDEGVKKTLVYPLLGEGIEGDNPERLKAVAVVLDGKWEKHARFLVLKRTSFFERAVSFFSRLWPF